MSLQTTVSPSFRDDPRGWTQRMFDRLMAPGVQLLDRDRKTVIKKRALYATYPGRTPGPHLYEQLCRIARSCGVLRQRPMRRSARTPTEIVTAPRPVPPPFAVGAPIPRPPPLRRPVAMLEAPETWDPAGSPGR